jgi:AcrR family transcriptional regulator
MSTNISTKEDLMQQQILAVAKRLFQVYGLAKVTMDDVAKAMGKGRSSLYYYYKSKDEIFDAVVMIEIHEMLAAMARAVDQASQKTKIVHHNLIIRQESILLKELLTDGISKGELCKMSAAELEMLILVLLSSLRGLKHELELEGNSKKLTPAVDMFTRMAIYGLKH